MRHFPIVLTGAAAFFGFVGVSQSQTTLPSAGQLLGRMSATTQPSAVAAPANASFADRAAALSKQITTLAPDEAARQWLALFDQESGPPAIDDAGEGINHMIAMRSGRGATDPLMEALPAPAAWESLSKAIEARPLPEAGDKRRRELALRAMAHLLANDTASLAKISDELGKLAMSNPALVMRIQRGSGASISQILLGRTEEPAAVADQFLQQIEVANEGTGFSQIEVPDLVTLVGAAKAEELLRKAIVAGAPISIDVGDATRKLAQKLAVELVAELKTPQWSLVTYNSPELYEALTRRFPPPSTRPAGIFSALSMRSSAPDRWSYERENAAQMYLVSLIVAGRSTEAVDLLKQRIGAASGRTMDTYALNAQLAEIDRAGHSAAVYATVRKILTENPDLPLWNIYQSVAARTGKTAEMLQQAREISARPGLDAAQQRAIRSILIDALLAADQVDEAVPLMETHLGDAAVESDDKTNTAMQLARLGTYLGKPEWTRRGLAAAIAAIAKPDPQSYMGSYALMNVISLMAENHQYVEALELIGDQLARNAAANGAKQTIESRMRQRQDNSRELLAAAVQIYHDASRHADVLELLRTAPTWQVSDLAESLTVQTGGDRPLGFIAAAALADAGQKDQARKILHALLDQRGGFDPAYELLVKIDGPAALAKLDELFSRDRFEERPLIWRAEILRQQRNLDEAEKTARQAIAIDPSDGEQPRGDRMRVYAVLASTLADKGNAEQAKFFREVVAAIRMSEDADRLHTAGLLKRAVEMYQTALTHFSDAYCIQSRLAIQLANMGMDRAAAEHYQRAYELMPESFGRVESHCFGCEQAFASEQAQSIAERVFTKFAGDQPKKPQVHYLLGYLREAQQRYPQALESFKTATTLDPDYLNAWKHIQGLAEHVHLSSPDLDAAAMNMIRLDPLQRHATAPLPQIRSLRPLWETVAKAREMAPQRPTELFRLDASADAIKNKPKDEDITSVVHYSSANVGRSLPTPAGAVASTQAMQLVRMLMQNPND